MDNLLREFSDAAVASPARAMPFAVYRNSDFYQTERQRIFHSDWVFVCNRFLLAEPGDRFAITIAGEPVVIVHGADGRLRALSNSCRHRGTPIADPGFSRGRTLLCPYHAWSYSDEGSLLAVPYSGNVEINKSGYSLTSFALEDWYGLLFVNISGDAPPLADRFSGIEPYLKLYGAVSAAGGGESEPMDWKANWKLVMENAMESYHLFRVHKPTLETVTPTQGAFYVAGSSEWAVTAGEIKGVLDSFQSFLGRTKSGPQQHYLLLMLPPSFVGILQADGSCEYLSILPLGPDNTQVRSGWLARQSGHSEGGIDAFTEAFFAEDRQICERVHSGMDSEHAVGGQLVELEQVLSDFHRYLASRICGIDKRRVYRSQAGASRLGL